MAPRLENCRAIRRVSSFLSPLCFILLLLSFRTQLKLQKTGLGLTTRLVVESPLMRCLTYGQLLQ